jgi:hypothetical protein
LAVQEAYDQALLCRKALINRENKLFERGQELDLAEAIDDVFILCVTLDHYPAITHQVDVYLRKKSEDPFPIALSIFDLDVLAFYLQDPFEFAYYLRQRVALSDYFKADSEITLLGRHLKQKLFKSGDADKEMLDNSFAQLIDANFQVARGSVPHTDAANKLRSQWKNEEFQKLIDQVKSISEPRFTDVLGRCTPSTGLIVSLGRGAPVSDPNLRYVILSAEAVLHTHCCSLLDAAFLCHGPLMTPNHP